jgi:hypothetical protein
MANFLTTGKEQGRKEESHDYFSLFDFIDMEIQTAGQADCTGFLVSYHSQHLSKKPTSRG